MSEEKIEIQEKLEKMEKCFEIIKKLIENTENIKDYEGMVEEIKYYVKELDEEL